MENEVLKNDKKIQNRVNGDTLAYFQEVTEQIKNDVGADWNAIYCELLNAYKLSKLKEESSVGGLIDQFDGYVNGIRELMINLLHMNNDAELRISQKFKDQIVKQSENNESLNNTIASLQKQLKELDIVVKEKDNELNRMNKEIETKDQILTANYQNVDLLNSNIFDLKAEILEMKDENRDLESKIEVLNDNLILKKEELAKSIKECELLNNDKKELIGECSGLKKSNEELHEENAKMYQINNENSALKKLIKDKDATIKLKEDSIVNLNQALAIANNDNEHLKENNEELKVRINELKEELKEFRTELKKEKEDE